MAWILAMSTQGSALILTVSTDSSLAGQTVTCADGTITLTQTFPSSSPYSVNFTIPNAGTWTISSGTASESVFLPDSIEIHEIPTGSTVTPTDDIQTWLHCANILNKTYTTISQVLADGSTVTALVASSNAVDYMARSTTWASSVCANSSAMTKIGANNYCSNNLLADSTWRTAICNSNYFENVLNVKVPTMTSNTTPTGEASAISVYSTNYAYRAFDNDSSESTPWKSTGDNQPNNEKWVQYKFATATKCYKALLYPLYANEPKDANILGSLNGTTFVTLASYSGNIPRGLALDLSNLNNYLYYRVSSKTNRSDGQASYTMIQFYGRADV